MARSACQQVGQRGVDRLPALVGQPDQDAAAVVRDAPRGPTSPRAASRSTRLVMVPEVTRVSCSSWPGVSW